MAHIKRKPVARTKVNYWILFVILGAGFAALSFTFSHLINEFTQFKLTIFNKLFSVISDATGIISFTCIIVSVVFFVTPLVIRYKAPLLLLKMPDFKNWLYAVRIYVDLGDDSKLIKYPSVNLTDSGFRIEAIGGTQEKLLKLNDDLSNYLARIGVDQRISESYIQDGWVYYILENNFRNDQL